MTEYSYLGRWANILSHGSRVYRSFHRTGPIFLCTVLPLTMRHGPVNLGSIDYLVENGTDTLQHQRGRRW